ncbi:amino acid permease [Candidatus Hakubella thermalkaliphila]|nr:APC family permease [Candidatus Hakubella thermalkaliphila]
MALLLDHPLGEGDAETINSKVITDLTSQAWGLYKTVCLSLQKTIDFVDTRDMKGEEKKIIRSRAQELQRAIEQAPKSVKWKLRAAIGEKIQWYDLPEEVARGATSTNAYQEIIDAAAKDGYTPLPWGSMPIAASLALIPMVVFFNLWPNWGTTLYGEVRGASDYKRNVLGMGGALLVTTILAIIFLALIAKTIGWEFYHAANFTFWAGTSPLPLFPYPGLLVAFITQNPVLQLWILLSLSLWFWGWSGTVFLSSSRVIFAAAFDRVLPEWMATVSARFRTPTGALIVMTIPSIIVSLLYSYYPGFITLTLASAAVIAITYVGTTVAAIVLPYRKRELFNASPVSRYTIGGIPAITISGVIFLLFLLYNIYMWSVDAVYGLNSPLSAIYMLSLYILAIVLYFGFKRYRRRQGIDINMAYQEIPVE